MVSVLDVISIGQILKKDKICRSEHGNPNHPKRGQSVRVDPIRNPKDIRLIKKLLSDHPRNLAIFTLGINTNLRASDLVSLTVGQVRYLKTGEYFQTKERKTGKSRQITINNTVCEVLQGLLTTIPQASDDEPLFQSRKGGGRLTTQTIHALVKDWCRQINLKGNFGSHTLRKTFGYMHRTVHGTDIPTLMTIFNYSSQKQTLDYLGIQPEEIQEAYRKKSYKE